MSGFHCHGKRIPRAMAERIEATRQRGGKAFLTTAQGDGSCTNCAGTGRLWLELVTGGPYDRRPTGSCVLGEDSHWYTVSREWFGCPVCKAPVRPDVVREVVL